MHSTANMLDAIFVAERRLLKLRRQEAARFPIARVMDSPELLREVEESEKYRLLEGVFEMLTDCISQYAAHFKEDDLLVSAVESIVMIVDIFGFRKHFEDRSKDVCLLLDHRLSPVMVIAFEKLLYHEFSRYSIVLLYEHSVLEVGHVLVSLESQLGAENLKDLHIGIVAAVLRPHLVELFDVPPENHQAQEDLLNLF